MFVMSVAERCQQASVFVYRCVLCDSGVYVRVMAPPIWPAQHTQEERESERERESGKLQLICSWLFFESEVFTMKHKDFISTVGVINDSSVDW